MQYILIIAWDWVIRALIGAQLKEEGFEPIGAAGIVEAVSRLQESGIRPLLVLMDTRQLTMKQEAIDLLGEACPGAPLVIIHGAAERPSQLRWATSSYQWARPLTVGQIVERVKGLVSQ